MVLLVVVCGGVECTAGVWKSCARSVRVLGLHVPGANSRLIQVAHDVPESRTVEVQFPLIPVDGQFLEQVFLEIVLGRGTATVDSNHLELCRVLVSVRPNAVSQRALIPRHADLHQTLKRTLTLELENVCEPRVLANDTQVVT